MALLVSYAFPFIFPKQFPEISVLSIFTPVLIVLNILFVLFWLIRLRRYFLWSLAVLLLGFPYFNRFLKFYNSSPEAKPDDITLMTFNTRLFNHYQWNPDKDLDKKIITFIEEKHPDIVTLQEFYRNPKYMLKGYPYHYVAYKNQKDNIGQAIFSRFPIVNKGSLNFPHTGNNGIFTDLLIKNDTIRVYNLHFESLHVNPEEEEISQENSKRLFKNIGKRFAIQQDQLEIYSEHSKKNTYKTIVCGDFNNTAFSHIYRAIKGDNLQDSFEKSGVGFGRTFNFKYFPFRIDYILIDKSFEITNYQNFNVNYSDHFPIMASFRGK